jgi:WD40 repeat protein
MQRQKANQQLYVWSSVLLIVLITGVVIRFFVEQPYRDLIKVQKGIIERVRLGHNGTVKSANFSPNGKQIVTISISKNNILKNNNTVKVWNTSGELLA